MNFKARWLSLALVGLVFAPTAALNAQVQKPVAVVSIASIRDTLADISYLARTAGMEDAGKSATLIASALVSGIDRERPIGVYFVPKSGDFHGVVFIPVEPNGLKTLLNTHRDQLGEAKNAGDGVLEVGRAKTVFVKEQNGWAFAAESKEHLAQLPPDPAALLGNMPKTYNVAVRLMMQNVPDQLRQMITNEMRIGIDRVLSSPAARQGKVDRDQVEQVAKSSIANIEKLLNESDEILIGLGINENEKNLAIDIGFSAKEGTSLAKQMASQADAKTAFAGLLLPESSVTISVVSVASQQDIEQIKPMLKAGRTQWAKQIDDDPDIAADKREAMKNVMNQFFDVLEGTISTGRIDGGAALVLLPKSIAFVAGGAVADGAAVDKALQSLVEWGKGQPDFPTIKLNAGTIGNVKVHRLTAPIPEREQEARDLLGDKLEVVIGVGPKSVVVAGGKEADGLLKKVLDSSAQQPNVAVPPLQINVALLPILKFYRSVDDNPIVGRIISALEAPGGGAANDRISIVNRAAARSSTTRIEIQEGVIKAAGEAAKAAGARIGAQ